MDFWNMWNSKNGAECEKCMHKLTNKCVCFCFLYPHLSIFLFLDHSKLALSKWNVFFSNCISCLDGALYGEGVPISCHLFFCTCLLRVSPYHCPLLILISLPNALNGFFVNVLMSPLGFHGFHEFSSFIPYTNWKNSRTSWQRQDAVGNHWNWA